MAKPHRQAAFEAICFFLREERAKTQMTLGKLISRLEELLVKNPTVKIKLHSPHSYRGYYDDLAFEIEEENTVKDALSSAARALNTEFTGYKGGDFRMDENTPIWLASYGLPSKLRLVAIKDDGTLVSSIEPESTEEDYHAARRKAKAKFGPKAFGGLLND